MHSEEAKVTKQQPLPPTVDKGPGKVIPEKQKPENESDDSGSNSDSSDVIMARFPDKYITLWKVWLDELRITKIH